MFVLIWVSLLSFVTCNRADTGALREFCTGNACVSLNEATITAEAGLCVVIPCSFRQTYFTKIEMIWLKCEPWRRCLASETIFHSDKNNTDVQTGFRGRVSLLEPDKTRQNCSIIINDLTESDSGSYQFKLVGYSYYGGLDQYSFPEKVTLLVTGLTQRPTLTVPTLMAGQQSTLICTAPGLCSGCDPKITWSWPGNGGNISYSTADETETLTPVTKRYSSALTLNASADNHGNGVICEVSFRGDLKAAQTAVLNVTYVQEVRITGNTSVMEGETLSLTCSVKSFPPSVITWTTLLDRNEPNATETGMQNSSIWDDTSLGPQEGSGTSIHTIANVSTADSGQYVCRVKHMNTTLEKIIDVRVIYWRTPVITGSTSVEEGDALNLTCSVDSFPPSSVTWTKSGSTALFQSDEGSAALFIRDARARHSGCYTCMAQHLNTKLAVAAHVTVTRSPNILPTSKCTIRSDVLTCLCISQGSPVPSIKWPILKNLTEYSVITSVSGHTVNSTLVLAAQEKNIAKVQCNSGKLKKHLIISRDELPEVLNIEWLQVIVAFLLGVLLSAIIWCLVIKCHRMKQRSFGNLEDTVEMVTGQEDPLMDPTLAVEDGHQEQAGGGTHAAGKAAVLHLNGEPKEVEYASIDFSALINRPRRSVKKQETAETEYAEVKREKKDTTAGSGRVEDDAKKEEEEEDKDTVGGGAGEEGREEESVYSSVKDALEQL